MTKFFFGPFAHVDRYQIIRGAIHGAEADPGQPEAPVVGRPRPDADNDVPSMHNNDLGMLVDGPNNGSAEADAPGARVRGPVPMYEQDPRRRA